VKRGVLGMAALIKNAQFSLFGRHDGDENLVIVMALTEVGTQTTLPCMN